VLQGFEKVEQTSQEDGRRGYVWRLSENALREGVQSTTRYRKKPPPSKHLGHKSRRHSLVGVNGRIGKGSKHNLRRSTRLQPEFLNTGPEDEYLEHPEGIKPEHGVSPSSSYLAGSSSTRGYTSFPTDTGSPMRNSMHMTPDWAFNPISDFTAPTEMPRSELEITTCGASVGSIDPLQYSTTSNPANQAHPSADFRALAAAEAHQLPPREGGIAALHINNSYGASHVWDDFCRDAGHPGNDQQPLLSLERDNMGVGSGGFFSIPQSDHGFHMFYAENDEQ
jgi:hypothetical protein